MVQRKGVKNGVATNKTVKQTFLGSKANQLHGVIIETVVHQQLDIATQHGRFNTVLTSEVPYSLDKHKRWEQYPGPVSSKDDSEFISQAELKRKRKEKNRTVKKEQNVKEMEQSNYEKRMLKKLENRKKVEHDCDNHEETDIKKKSKKDNNDEHDSDNEESENVVYRTMGHRYGKYERLDVLNKYNFISGYSQWKYKDRFGRTEVWLPPTKEFVQTHYPQEDKYRDYYMSHSISEKQRDLKKEVHELNKMVQ
jgi:hypothetical protein